MDFNGAVRALQVRVLQVRALQKIRALNDRARRHYDVLQARAMQVKALQARARHHPQKAVAAPEGRMLPFVGPVQVNDGGSNTSHAERK